MRPDQTNKIKGRNTEGSTVTEHTVYYDILFEASVPGTDSSETVSLIINIEAQNKYYNGYPLIERGIYYCGRLLSSQYGKEFEGSHYEKLKKVYSIWICMNVPLSLQNTITVFRVQPEAVVGNAIFDSAHYDLLRVVMVGLGQEALTDSGLLNMLAVLFSDTKPSAEKLYVLQHEYDIANDDGLNEGVEDMCNLSQGLIEKSMERGLKQGMQQGMKKGITDTRTENLKSIMEALGLTFEQAAEILHIPAAELSLYRKLIEDQI